MHHPPRDIGLNNNQQPSGRASVLLVTFGLLAVLALTAMIAAIILAAVLTRR